VRPYLEKKLSHKRAGGVAQDVGPELKPSTTKKKKKKSPNKKSWVQVPNTTKTNKQTNKQNPKNKERRYRIGIYSLPICFTAKVCDDGCLEAICSSLLMTLKRQV
jgi:hypothetical protein